mmetsp:Transcript_15470/g.46692  ORF Transcript_15470/g.46692 Transcript_15470/m.46692 type:complete len:324 (-) Transcript_15470:1904-2875(-)
MGLQQILERLAVTFYVVTFMSGIWGWFMVPLFLFNIWTIVPYVIYLGLTWFGPLKDAHKDITWRTPFRWLPVWNYAASFYPAKLHRTEELDPDKNYIFAAHPHGIFCSSLFLAFSTESLGFSKIFPGLSVHFLTLPGHFKNPFVRDWILLHGMLDTSRATCQRIVGKGSGRCIAMAVGGARESLFVEPGTMNIILDRRMGFVRLAVETGASLVPVICFGENDLFDAEVVGADTFMGRFQKWGLKNVGITSPNFSWLGPHRVPVNVVCGAPIKVEKFAGDIATAEGAALVAKTHATYKQALLDLYQANKDKYHKNRKEELKIIA